jgi:signal transduction histidine kinase
MISTALRVTSDGQLPLNSALWPSCRLGNPLPPQRQQNRLNALEQLGLTNTNSVPAFDDATQLAARFLHADVCLISIADPTTEQFKAAYGLSHLGLGNPLSQTRQLPLADGLSQYVLDSEQPLWLGDTTCNPVIADSPLVKTYGLMAYAGVPLKTSQQQCIGVLAVMGLTPREFTPQDIAFLEMTARWSVSEYERQRAATNRSQATDAQSPTDLQTLIQTVRLNLIGQLTQDLRNPLTAVMGMASMLSREIYGPLTHKQQEYVNVVLASSQTMMNRVDEIVDLGIFDTEVTQLVPSQVDIAILGQQVLNTLEPMATKREQTFNLTVEPGEKLWVVDQKTVKQILYHLIFSIIQLAGNSSTLRLHASRKGNFLTLAVWLSNPWLGDGLPQTAVRLCHMAMAQPQPQLLPCLPGDSYLAPEESVNPEEVSRDLLGFLLSRQLAERHGGCLQLQGNVEAGHRCVVTLASLETMLPQGAGDAPEDRAEALLDAASF